MDDMALYNECYTMARNHLNDSIETQERLICRGIAAIVLASNDMADAFKAGNKILLCGNGGSAAECQHIAAELVNLLNLKTNRPALPAIALTTDTSILTAAANDFGYDKVFDRQVQALGVPGDILIGITTSGNSPNILSACKIARQNKIKTVILTGSSGKCYSDDNVDLIIGVPSTNTQFIQESHTIIGHVLCELVEFQCFGVDEL